MRSCSAHPWSSPTMEGAIPEGCTPQLFLHFLARPTAKRSPAVRTPLSIRAEHGGGRGRVDRSKRKGDRTCWTAGAYYLCSQVFAVADEADPAWCLSNYICIPCTQNKSRLCVRYMVAWSVQFIRPNQHNAYVMAAWAGNGPFFIPSIKL